MQRHAVDDTDYLASDATFGSYTFNTPSNAAASDDVYAQAASTVALFSGNMEYLKATGFSFSVPASATICGIEVQVERSADNIGLFTSVDDASIRLLKGGSVTGNNHAAGTNWTSADVVAAYGSSSDVWSTALAAGDVNAGDFGVAVSSRIDAGSEIHVTNPIATQINVSCAAGIQSISLYSTRGERLMEKELDTPVSTFATDATLLPPGVYVLKINGHTRLLIKR